MKWRMDETPAKMCGGRVFEIGGLEKEFVLGAGVERVLHNVRIEFITHPGASGIEVEVESPFGRSLGDFRRESGVEALLLMVRFSGLALLGVFRGLGVGVCLEGVVFVVVAPFRFDGVAEGPYADREGVAVTELLPERFETATFVDRERSRKE